MRTGLSQGQGLGQGRGLGLGLGWGLGSWSGVRVRVSASCRNSYQEGDEALSGERILFLFIDYRQQ